MPRDSNPEMMLALMLTAGVMVPIVICGITVIVFVALAFYCAFWFAAWLVFTVDAIRLRFVRWNRRRAWREKVWSAPWTGDPK